MKTPHEKPKPSLNRQELSARPSAKEFSLHTPPKIHKAICQVWRMRLPSICAPLIIGIVSAHAPRIAAAQTPSHPQTDAMIARIKEHRALLASAPREADQDDASYWRKDLKPILHSHSESPLELLSERGLSTGGGYYVSSKDGRDVEIGEWTLGVRANPKLSLWYGFQNISAKGRTRIPRRSSFNANAKRFGIRVVLKGTEARGLALQYDNFNTGLGEVAVGNSGALLPGPKTDTVQLIYSFGRKDQEEPAFPTHRARLMLSNVQGIGAGATLFGGGGGASFKIARGLSGDADILGLIETRRDNNSDVNFRLHSTAALTYQPAPWAKLQATLELSPLGVPLGGTSLSGLSSFGVYQRNDGVSGLSNGAVAVFNLRFVIGTRF